MNQKKILAEIKFYKVDSAVFLSHLDLVRLFSRVFRIVSMPIVYSNGFNPHPRISFNRALKLGVGSKCEKMKIQLTEKIDLKIKKDEINERLPKGIRISKIEYWKEKTDKKSCTH